MNDNKSSGAAERKAFEIAMRDIGILPATLKRSGDGYAFVDVAWKAWKARAALAAQPEPAQPAPSEPTDEMVTAYLAANNAYWREVDALPESQSAPSKWRQVTPREATKVSLKAALAVAQSAPVYDVWRVDVLLRAQDAIGWFAAVADEVAHEPHERIKTRVDAINAALPKLRSAAQPAPVQASTEPVAWFCDAAFSRGGRQIRWQRDKPTESIHALHMAGPIAEWSPLYAAPQVLSGWQPIETAPLDGTIVDLWMVDAAGVGQREADAYYVTNRSCERWEYSHEAKRLIRTYVQRDGWFAPGHDYEGEDGWCDDPRWFNAHPAQNRWVEMRATHWMPLPDAPIAARAAVSGDS